MERARRRGILLNKRKGKGKRRLREVKTKLGRKEWREEGIEGTSDLSRITQRIGFIEV